MIDRLVSEHFNSCVVFYEGTICKRKQLISYMEAFHGEDKLTGYASDNSSDIEVEASSELPITGTQSSQEDKQKSLPPH